MIYNPEYKKLTIDGFVLLASAHQFHSQFNNNS